MKTITRFLLILAVIFSLADARPSSSSGGGSSRPSSSMPSRPYSSPSSSPSRSYSSPSSSPSKPSASPSSGWGSSQKATPAQKQAAPTNPGSSYTAPKQSGADKALTDKVNQSGSSTVNRATAQQQKDAVSSPRNTTSTSTGTNRANSTTTTTTTTTNSYRYSVQPSVWPIGLPVSYFYMGMTHAIIWDSIYGGYGWYHGNRWYYYDEAYRAGVAAGANGTAVASNQGIVTQPDGTRVYTSPPRSYIPWGWIFFWTIFGCLFVLFIIWLVNRESSATYHRAYDDGDEEVVETSRTTTVTTDNYNDPVPQERTSFRPAQEVTENTRMDKFRGKADITRVQPGDVIQLSDALSLKDAKELNPKAKHLGVVVNSVTRIQEKDGFATWTILRGKSETGQSLMINIKDVDNNRSISCYTLDIEGTRQELIEGGNQWLFVSPESDSFDPMTLNYTQWFNRKLDGDKEDLYELKRQGELHGVATFNPTRAGQPELLATVAEYACGRSQECDQYLILELGNGSRSTVECFWGATIDHENVKLV